MEAPTLAYASPATGGEAKRDTKSGGGGGGGIPRLQEAGLVVVILVLGTILSIYGHYDAAPGRPNTFLNFDNLVDGIATPMSYYAIMAIGVTIVIITGGIDISVGSSMALAALGAAAVLENFRPDAPAMMVLPVALAVPVGVGLLCGLVNGALVVGLRMHPFIVTLGTLSIFRGIANVATPIKTLPGPGKRIPEAFTSQFMRLEMSGLIAARALVAGLWLAVIAAVVWLIVGARREQVSVWRQMSRMWLVPGPGQRPGQIVVSIVVLLVVLRLLWALIRVTLGVFTWDYLPPVAPMPLIIMLICTGLGWIFLHLLVAGRETYAIGGNEEAARFSGLRVNWIKLRVYVLAGLAAGVAGMVSLGRFGTASTSTGTGYELTVIAAAVVGGASLSGGRGTALGALLGTLIIALIENGIYILHLEQEYRSIIIGIAIIIAVALDRFSEYLRNRRLKGGH